MSKKFTPLWREAHFEIKMYQTLGFRTIFGGSDVEKKCTPLWREVYFEVTLHYSILFLQYTPLH